MISQSWDGTRVYITSSLLANWDKGGADNEQFLRGFTVGRQGADAGLRGGLHQGEARTRPPHEAGVEGPAHRLRRAERAASGAARSRMVTPPLAAAALLGLVAAVRRRASGRRASARWTSCCPEPGTYRAPPHHARAGRAGADRGRAPGEALAVHARADHAARLHLHDLHRPAGLPARVSGLRPAEGRDPGHAGPEGQGAARDLELRSRARLAVGHEALRRQPARGRGRAALVLPDHALRRAS